MAAAGEVFAAEGLSATLADVAARAEVGVATVYRRFANKDELILALFEIHFEKAQTDVRRAIEAEDPWLGFVTFFEGGVRLFSQDKGFRDFVVSGYADSFGWARGASPERVEQIVQEHHHFMRTSLEQMLQRCQAAGVIRNDVTTADLFALTMAAVSSIDFASRKGGPQIHRRVVGIMLDGLRPSRQAPTPLPDITQ
nr:TetR/AcrR family transcriptional regulator [Kineosporia babensis]